MRWLFGNKCSLTNRSNKSPFINYFSRSIHTPDTIITATGMTSDERVSLVRRVAREEGKEKKEEERKMETPQSGCIADLVISHISVEASGLAVFVFINELHWTRARKHPLHQRGW